MVLQLDRSGRQPSGIESRLGTAGSRVMGVFTFVVLESCALGTLLEHTSTPGVLQTYSSAISGQFSKSTPGDLRQAVTRNSGLQQFRQRLVKYSWVSGPQHVINILSTWTHGVHAHFEARGAQEFLFDHMSTIC